jgi:hypothetical protein
MRVVAFVNHTNPTGWQAITWPAETRNQVSSMVTERVGADILLTPEAKATGEWSLATHRMIAGGGWSSSISISK